MRQNGNHMCLLVHCAAHLLDAALYIVCNRCFDAIRISNWSCCSIQCAQRWPTNTISLIYCNGFKLCDCTSLWMVVYFLATTNCTIFITPSVLITIKCSFLLFIFLLKIYFNYFESIDNHLNMFSVLSSALMIPNVLATGLSYCRRYKVFSHYIRWLRNHKCCWCLQMMSSISNSLLVIFRTGPHTPKCGSHLLLNCALFLLSFADDVQFIFSGT